VESGVMHGCGHDAHMTVWGDVAREMAPRQDEWSGTLVTILQPAKEKAARRVLQFGRKTP